METRYLLTHEVKHEVNISVIFGSNHILKSDYIFMSIQLLEKHNFSEGPLRVCRVLKGIKVLLERDDLLSPLVYGLPHDTVGSFAQFLEDLVLLKHMRFDFFSHIVL